MSAFKRILSSTFLLSAIAGSMLLGALLIIPAARESLRHGAHSDIGRHWVVAQYVLMGSNPYALAAPILKEAYGPAANLDYRATRVYRIPQDIHLDGLLLDSGPPEATYPPSSALLLTLLLGSFPLHSAVFLWAVLSTGSLILLALTLANVLKPGASGPLRVRIVVAAFGLCVLWPPSLYSIEMASYAIPGVLFLFLAVEHLEKRTFVSGCALALALVKPSLSLPFVLLPLIRRKWAVVFFACGVHLIVTLAASIWFREWPHALLISWIGVAKYFMQGMYTFQEILNGLSLTGRWEGIAVPLLFLLLGAFWTWSRRRQDNSELASFLSLLSLYWMYHNRYDFVLLLIPLTYSMRALWTGRARYTDVCIIGGILFLGLALSPLVWAGQTNFAHAMRWAARLCMPMLLAAAAVAPYLRSRPLRTAITNRPIPPYSRTESPLEHPTHLAAG